jgi:hypothetical protein
MGRTHNPDYYKVGAGTAGSGASSGGRFSEDRSRLTAERARLRGSPPHPAGPTNVTTRKPGTHTTTREHRTHSRSPAAPPAKRPAASSPATSPGPGPAVRVEAIHVDRPRHGKKRRSAQKRHDDAVLKRARAVPTAPVADLRDRPAPARQRMPSSLPGALAARLRLSRVTIGLAVVRALATLPLVIARRLGRRRRARA